MSNQNSSRRSLVKRLLILIVMAAVAALMLTSRSCVSIQSRVKLKTVYSPSKPFAKRSSSVKLSCGILPRALAGSLNSKPSMSSTVPLSSLRKPLKNNYIDYRVGAGDFPNAGHFAGNVGNLRYSARNNWIGQGSPVSGFCTFTGAKYGLRATCITLRSYLKALGPGATVSQIIHRYAPPSENDTSLYEDYVCAATGFTPSTVVLSACDILRLSLAVVFMETNYRPSFDEIVYVFESLRV